MALDILIIDDETDIRDIISDILKDEGFTSRSASNSTQAFKAISEKTPNAIILDIYYDNLILPLQHPSDRNYQIYNHIIHP